MPPFDGSHWTVTNNIIDKDEPDCKIGRPPKEDETRKFRLLDDDKEVYFEGLMTPIEDERLFDPLDTIGASYGCTGLQVFENGAWDWV